MTKLDWKPARLPERIALDGDAVRVEPVNPPRHAKQLFESSAGADSIWDYLPYGPFASQAQFTDWLEARAASNDPLFFTITNHEAGEAREARGMASLLRMAPEHGVIEIGHIWFAPTLQRTRAATEAIYLLSRYAFELGNRRYEWKCNALNVASRRAAERFGFTFEGVFRQHMVVKGRNRDTAWYSMTDAEWPSRRAAFEAWLSPDNFDSAGRQRRSLAELRHEIQAPAR
jgi:RimJ/RimL family protein N-acetyltransferase